MQYASNVSQFLKGKDPWAHLDIILDPLSSAVHHSPSPLLPLPVADDMAISSLSPSAFLREHVKAVKKEVQHEEQLLREQVRII